MQVARLEGAGVGRGCVAGGGVAGGGGVLQGGVAGGGRMLGKVTAQPSYRVRTPLCVCAN